MIFLLCAEKCEQTLQQCDPNSFRLEPSDVDIESDILFEVVLKSAMSKSLQYKLLKLASHNQNMFDFLGDWMIIKLCSKRVIGAPNER